MSPTNSIGLPLLETTDFKCPVDPNNLDPAATS
jgi:hypothetical protein